MTTETNNFVFQQEGVNPFNRYLRSLNAGVVQNQSSSTRDRETDQQISTDPISSASIQTNFPAKSKLQDVQLKTYDSLSYNQKENIGSLFSK